MLRHMYDITDDAALGLGVAGLTLATSGLGDAAVLGAEGTDATVEADPARHVLS